MGTTGTRSRSLVYRQPFRQITYARVGEQFTDKNYSSDSVFALSGIKGGQTTTSRENPGWKLYRSIRENPANPSRRFTNIPDLVRRLERQDLGANFETLTTEYTDNSVLRLWENQLTPSRSYYSYSRIYARGPAPRLNHPNWPTLVPDDLNVIRVYGTKAISETIPGSPASDTLVNLAELYREGFPSIPGRSFGSRRNPKGAASDYLNWEFGIKPLVGGLQDLRNAIVSQRRILQEYRRLHGVKVKRKHRIPTQTTETLMSTDQVPPTGLPAGIPVSSVGNRTCVRTEQRKYWFSAAYMTFTHDPGAKSAIDRLESLEQDLYRVYGIRITPDVIWNLLPWSWLVDWVTNVGDVVHNVSVLSRGDVIMPYAYAMCTHSISDKWVTEPVQGVCGPMSQVFTTTHKRRLRASPFGFGQTPADFSARQWAILGALGITNVR